MLSFKKIFAAAFAALFALSSLSAQRKTDVWDFGGVASSGKNVSNHISIDDLNKLDQLGSNGKFSADGDIVFGDLTLNVKGNDRAYNAGKKNYGSQGYSVFDFGDGYISDGLYYCNGKGGENSRYMLVKNVKAGDTITFYARTSNSGDEKIHFSSVGDDGARDGKQDEIAPLSAKSEKYEYVAASSGSYKIWAAANAGKPVYYRLVRRPGVSVSGKLTGLPKGTAQLKFIDTNTKLEIPADVKGSSYSAGLPPNHSFTAVLIGVKGYAVTPQSKTLFVSSKDAESGSLKKDLAIDLQKTFAVSGKITGIAPEYDASKLKVIMTPPAGSLYQPVEMEVSGAKGDYSFNGEIEPDVAYTASFIGANDYEIADSGFKGNAKFTKDIKAALKKTYAVSGKFFGEVSQIPSKVEFKNLEDGYVYAGSISASNYSVSLRDGTYEVLASTEKAATGNHIIVKGASVTKDIKMTAREADKSPLKLQKDLYVGKKGYATVQEAVDAAARMNPQSEKDRITIHIEPGVYRSQLFIAVPYITLKNDKPEKEVKLTWYYGIGYKYYSADKDGWFNADLAYDKFEKKTVAKWGAATYVKPEAKGFRAEGITFETSFNKYVCEEEISDGVETDGSINFDRKLGSDVRSKAATERAAALLVYGDKSEFINCRFLGSQDTLYTGEGTTQYYRNCFIEGNTDFIFGDGDAVFENCEISLAGYTDRAQGGYLTAARKALHKGYLFYDCLISSDQGTFQAPAFFGRPWGADAKVAFVNTTFGNASVVATEGWTSMSGNSPEKAGFKEFNSVWGGKSVETSARTKGSVLQSEKGFTPADYLAGWTPEYSASDKKAKDSFDKKPSFTTDDDINTPYPGHTITVHYSLKKAENDDISLIHWFRVKDGSETLVKVSRGFADKTYLIQREDSGCKIKAVVTPILRGGKASGAKSIELDAKVLDGYALPSKASASRPRAVGKLNVFLAGDSTVKDYSKNGMWNSNQARNEGSWGEFLQAYFNDAVSIQNYANGGRSARNFINEGSLEKIAGQIMKGDFLFIQFGHNDCANGSGYLEDRYVPLGKPDSKGIYPVTEGKKVKTPASYVSKYGETFYSYDCGGTYKWYLKQYIDVARNAGATPVLVTPVSRLYFEADGKIRPHHDSTDTSTKTQVTSNNAYVEAVRQLAKEENVILIDGFELSKKFYESSWAETGSDKEAKALMNDGESTHNNKLGGFALADLFAASIKEKIPALKNAVVRPKNVTGAKTNGTVEFSVDADGKIDCQSAYWKNRLQKMINQL